MASGEEARSPSITSSSVSLEALFPGGVSDQACEDGDPELVRLRERLQGWLSQYEPLLLWLQRLLVWERPLYSIFVALTLNTLFWLLSATSLRPLFLLSVSLLGLMLLERWKDKLPLATVTQAEANPILRETLGVAPHLLSIPELSHHLAESYLTCCLYLQEMLQYKEQNHGKFCGMMCGGCIVLALVGHYVPGIMISYIMALSVLLWPLVVYHELIQRMYTGLEPILMKLDYSMKGNTEHRKRKVKKEVEEGDEPRVETESESEEELSCFAPTVDAKTTALAMAITDSELSDEEASILESGGFSVSRATTPQLTDVSEDLDQQSVHSEPEESYLRDLPEFPSVEELPSIEHGLLHFPLQSPSQGPADQGSQRGEPSEGEPLSPASLLIQHLASPLHFVNTHFNGHGRPPGGEGGTFPGVGGGGMGDIRVGEEGEATAIAAQGPQRSLEALSEEIVSTAISTVVQNTLSAMLRSSEASEEPTLAEFLPTETPPSALETPPSALETPPSALETPPSALETTPSALETTSTPADATAHTTTTTTTTMPTPGLEVDPDEAVTLETGAGEEIPDDTLVPTEEEDFELLDQSELDQMDEGLGFSSDRQVVGGASGAPDTPPSLQHQPES